MSASDTVLEFIKAINDHDVDRIVGLCADDHTFVDAHGAVVSSEGLSSAWAGYFQFMPRYGIEVETILSDEGGQVGVFGWAWGALDREAKGARAWRRPCAWRAQVREGRIRVWQVYVDTKAVFELL